MMANIVAMMSDGTTSGVAFLAELSPENADSAADGFWAERLHARNKRPTTANVAASSKACCQQTATSLGGRGNVRGRGDGRDVRDHHR